MSQEISNSQFYLGDPRLRMTIAGRSLVRVVSGVTYLVLVVAAITFLLSYDIRSIFYLGIFLVLIVLDLLIHKRDGDVRISALPKEGRIDLATVIKPSAFLAIERAVDASVITKKSFLLELTDGLLEYPEIENGLRRLDINPQEFRQKLGTLLAESSGVKEGYLHESQALAIHAFHEAVAASHDFIEISDLFSALPNMNDVSLDRLFALFSMNSDDLRGALMLSSLSLHWVRAKTNTAVKANEKKALIYKSVVLEKRFHIVITFSAITRAGILAKKYLSEESLVSGAEELLADALAEAERRGEKVLTADRVTEAAEEKFNSR